MATAVSCWEQLATLRQEYEEAQRQFQPLLRQVETLRTERDEMSSLLEQARQEVLAWKEAVPQSSVCPKCGFQTVHRYPEPPGAGELALVQEIKRLRALLRELEWGIPIPGSSFVLACPYCHQRPDEGHARDCVVMTTLGG